MSRRLSASEIAMWSRVAATIRPLPGKSAHPPAHQPQAPGRAFIPRQTHVHTPAPIPPRSLNGPAKTTPVAAATLDGGWDRRLRQGNISPDRTLDLHGYTLENAHALLSQALHSAETNGDRIILIITGKGRENRPGRIKAELNHWLDSGQHRSRIAALRPAHPRHGGGGAFYLILKRDRP